MSYKFNIHPDDCRYIVNEDKRKVICLIENTKTMFIDFAERNFDIPCDCMDYSYLRPTRNLYDKLLMPKRFWGVATCAEDDEWDEEKGRLLAFTKAKNKLNNSFFKRAQLYVDTFDKSLNDAILILNNLGNKLTANADRRHEKLKDLLGEDKNGVSAN